MTVAATAASWFATRVCTAAAAELEVQLLAPERLLDPRAREGSGPFVRYPWPLSVVSAEVAEVNHEVTTRDGVELAVTASAGVLAPGAAASLYVGLFSISLIGPQASVEEWMREGNLPPPHNPLRLWTLYAHQFRGGPVQPDELGDACLGEAYRAEFCARVTACLRVVGAAEGGGRWRIAVPIQHATNFRFEVYLGEPAADCDQEGPRAAAPGGAPAPPWWAPLIAERAVASRSGRARYAAFAQFRVLFVSATSWWWSQSAAVDPVDSWMELMGSVVEAAASSPAASPGRSGLPVVEGCPHGLWLEFGVGSGKTTAAIATRLQRLLGDQAVLHGFDSFQGLPVSWQHTKLGAGTFSTGGEVPEHLRGMPGVQIHVGLFSATLSELDAFAAAPVAFAHVDVDLYSSAVEVLSRIACQLLPGSVLLFDELVNYAGFELLGEFRAWDYISTAYQIGWEYAGLYWQQAVPVIITQRGAVC